MGWGIAAAVAGGALLDAFGKKKEAKANARSIEAQYQNELYSARLDLLSTQQYSSQIMAVANAKMAFASSLAKHQKKAGKAQEKALFQEGDQVRAISHRKAYWEDLAGQKVVGKAKNAVGKGGFVQSDISERLAQLMVHREVNKLTALWEGETQRNKLRFEGNVAAWNGKVQAAITTANATFDYQSTAIGVNQQLTNARNTIAALEHAGPGVSSAASSIRSSGNINAVSSLIEGGARAFGAYKI